MELKKAGKNCCGFLYWNRLNMIEFEKINKLPYMSKRMYVLKNICEAEEIDLEYLFGLFNLYNIKNSGKWFWQKAKFTGALEDLFSNFNSAVDKIVKNLGASDDKKTRQQIKLTSAMLDELLVQMETNCGVNRENDYGMVKKNLQDNFRELINDSLRRIK